MLEFFKQLDYCIFYHINGLWRHEYADLFFAFFRKPTNWIPLYLLLLGYAIFSFKWNFWRVLVCVGLSVGIADAVSSHLVKNAFKRLRPCNEPELLGTVINIVPCGSGYSFTSSHAANHFALAAALSMTLFRRKKYVQTAFFIWAGCVAYGQVYCGVHFLFDVLFGALLGIGIALLLQRWLYPRILRM